MSLYIFPSQARGSGGRDYADCCERLGGRLGAAATFVAAGRGLVGDLDVARSGQ